MAETLSVRAVLDAVRNSFVFVGPGFMRHGEGFVYNGVRPDGGWQGHGYFARKLRVLQSGRWVEVELRKRRWKRAGSNETCHSRPPDEVGGRSVCLTLLVLLLWWWLDRGVGLHDRDEQDPGFLDAVSKRTVQRYLRSMQVHALRFHQVCREVVVARCEPRPIELLFPRGLSPPERLRRHRWPNFPGINQLWTAIAFILRTAIELQIPTAVLLAEARGREAQHKHGPWP